MLFVFVALTKMCIILIWHAGTKTFLVFPPAFVVHFTDTPNHMLRSNFMCCLLIQDVT